MKITTYVLLMGVGVLIGMAACGANSDQTGPAAPATPPDQVPSAVEPAEQPQPEAAKIPETVKAPPEEAVQKTTEQIQQQTAQQQVADPTQQAQPPKPEPQVSPFTTEMDKVSYFLGTTVGDQLKQHPFDINFELFVKGLDDAFKDKELAMSQEEIKQVMTAYEQKMTAYQQKMMAKQQEMMAQQQEDAPKYLAEGLAFLEENKKQPGVVTLSSGLQYKILTPGTGPVPQADDTVLAHYRGTLLNGEEFDSSYKRNEPSPFPVTGVIPGWTEALQLMKVGAKWQLFIPSNLAYGPQGRPPNIPPNSVLIFEIELLEILPK
ncbi:FKBP-type peptidyl-prolyl cis-trans isomerase [Planctomycetota bacterium]